MSLARNIAGVVIEQRYFVERVSLRKQKYSPCDAIGGVQVLLNAAILNKIYLISSITAELNKLLSLKISPCSGMSKRRTQLGTVFVINVPLRKKACYFYCRIIFHICADPSSCMLYTIYCILPFLYFILGILIFQYK